jgi:hypothetical protein
LPTSGTSPRIRLPSDLPRSLTYLDDAKLRKLRDAVNGEIDRRSQMTGSRKFTRLAHRAEEAVHVPEGQANLIRASFKAGLKPAAKRGLPCS